MDKTGKKCVVLGVTGGIAAYKACEIVSLLRKAGYDVAVILTKSAAEFVTPLTFETLSGNPVCTDLFDRRAPWEVEHIALAKRADLFLVAPATANFIGKLYAGIADDMLTTTVMATKAPVLIAPAMNTHMYDNPITQRNIRGLQQLGYRFVEPAVGRLACGDVGRGHIAAEQEIVRAVQVILKEQRVENE